MVMASGRESRPLSRRASGKSTVSEFGRVRVGQRNSAGRARSRGRRRAPTCEGLEHPSGPDRALRAPVFGGALAAAGESCGGGSREPLAPPPRPMANWRAVVRLPGERMGPETAGVPRPTLPPTPALAMSLTRTTSRADAAAQAEGAELAVHLVTFGCQMNKYDSLLVEGRFRKAGRWDKCRAWTLRKKTAIASPRFWRAPALHRAARPNA